MLSLQIALTVDAGPIAPHKTHYPGPPLRLLTRAHTHTHSLQHHYGQSVAPSPVTGLTLAFGLCSKLSIFINIIYFGKLRRILVLDSKRINYPFLFLFQIM